MASTVTIPDVTPLGTAYISGREIRHLGNYQHATVFFPTVLSPALLGRFYENDAAAVRFDQR